MIPPGLKENVLLRDYTSFKVGGPARYFCEPASRDELRLALDYAHRNGIPLCVLGRGSNVVASDHGYDGLVVRLGDKMGAVRVEKHTLYAEAGALLNTAAHHAMRAGLGGLEKMSGIPGTVGGATFINAGAYGQEMAQVVTSVRSITRQGEERLRHSAQCEFSYRHSLYTDLDEIIVETAMELIPADPDVLRAAQRECLLMRKVKQPLELPNAGSMFKRPPGHFAGALIEASGLKGFSVGGAQVSLKHAGFVVNTGTATAAQIWELTERVIEKVERDHGIRLEREVIFLGQVP